MLSVSGHHLSRAVNDGLPRAAPEVPLSPPTMEVPQGRLRITQDAILGLTEASSHADTLAPEVLVPCPVQTSFTKPLVGS